MSQTGSIVIIISITKQPSDVPFYETCKHAVAEIKLWQNVFGACYIIQL